MPTASVRLFPLIRTCIGYADLSIDTMDARNITLNNFIYRGGDDCVAIKPRSYDIVITNLTCEGGNGIAIGSLGQYLEDNTVGNVTIRDAKVRFMLPITTQSYMSCY